VGGLRPSSTPLDNPRRTPMIESSKMFCARFPRFQTIVQAEEAGRRQEEEEEAGDGGQGCLLEAGREAGAGGAP
jgi:hypothetical protein